MPIADVTGYEVSLWLHITAVVIGFGATFAEAVTVPLALRLDPRHIPFAHRLGLVINRWFANPALLVVLATGFYQVADADLNLGEFWLSATIMIVLALGALNGAYFIPSDRRLAELAEREIAATPPGQDVQLSDEYARGARRQGIFGAITGVLIVVAIYLMVAKPFA